VRSCGHLLADRPPSLQVKPGPVSAKPTGRKGDYSSMWIAAGNEAFPDPCPSSITYQARPVQLARSKAIRSPLRQFTRCCFASIGAACYLKTTLAIIPLSSWFKRWQWKSEVPRMMGSVKSITRSTVPFTGTLTVSNHSVCCRGFPFTAYTRK
jgi:hypothetical protein